MYLFCDRVQKMYKMRVSLYNMYLHVVCVHIYGISHMNVCVHVTVCMYVCR